MKSLILTALVLLPLIGNAETLDGVFEFQDYQCPGHQRPDDAFSQAGLMMSSTVSNFYEDGRFLSESRYGDGECTIFIWGRHEVRGENLIKIMEGFCSTCGLSLDEDAISARELSTTSQINRDRSQILDEVVVALESVGETSTKNQPRRQEQFFCPNNTRVLELHSRTQRSPRSMHGFSKESLCEASPGV